MMPSIVALFALALSLQVRGHALIEPAIGVSGNGSRSDVQRPSNSTPCGNVNVASVLSSTTAVQMVNDAFTVTVQNFNGGKDGSRQVSAIVDPSATGKTFPVTATITKNGDLSPSGAGSQEVSVSLPSNTACTGGSDKNSCLVSFTTAGGFGNCVLVSQSTGADAANGSSSATGTASSNTPSVSGTSGSGMNCTDSTTTTDSGNSEGDTGSDTDMPANNGTAAVSSGSSTDGTASVTESSTTSGKASTESSASNGQKEAKPCKNKRGVYGTRAPRAFRTSETWDFASLYY